MIGQKILDSDGKVLDQYKNLSKSKYQPSDEVKKLWSRCQRDYQIAYALQHRAFKEFDGYSLLDRTRLDQETFAAFVGIKWEAKHKRWRWKGRKNTSRNKLIGILAHVIAGMLYPYVNARNQYNKPDKMAARVMKILIEDHLDKAQYPVKFLFIVLSALVHPAVFIQVEWVEAIQNIKQKLADGTYTTIQAVDEILSGLQLNTIPIDEILLSDFFSGTGNLQNLPVITRVRRIPWDVAREQYAGRFYDKSGKDLFDYVEAGKTRIVLTGNENQELYDIEWTEADGDFVQEITFYYRSDDLEVKFVGGVFMGNDADVYNSNPFRHRRLTLIKGQWLSIPVLPFVMGGFEPLDPAGRFAYFKSAAFKAFWDDQALNQMHRLALDGTALDVMKVLLISGIGKVDSTVMVPGAVVGMPAGAEVNPFSLAPNIKAIYDSIQQQEKDLSDSTQDNIMQGQQTPNTTATQSNIATQNAKVMLTVFGIFIAKLIQEVGRLSMDLIIDRTTIPELDNLVGGSLDPQFRSFFIKGSEGGKQVNHNIIFTAKHMGKQYTQKKIEDLEWEIYQRTGNTPKEQYQSDQRIYEVNPYQFARMIYDMEVDPDEITDKSLGATQQRKIAAANILMNPLISPFTNTNEVADSIIDEFGGDLSDDPDKLKKSSMPTPGQQPGQQPQNPVQPSPLGAVTPQSIGQPVL
jgi:hypothetical protein